MKVTRDGKKSRPGRSFIVRDTRSGHLSDVMSVPGRGDVTIVTRASFASAMDAAGNRLRMAIENTGGWKSK
ncbi:hypothetical protein [Jiella sonneratiae]|uniref:Uncharacterized protein n=1 Tax=Jiella sonneratiae TaxID=2816856 RepID=A0ABS3J4F0_9HYPH|nr:hypothetical protein [Jiella sonneratiae]MBO0903952.1 hypothetical protein [Jiella sonneratiae]